SRAHRPPPSLTPAHHAPDPYPRPLGPHRRAGRTEGPRRTGDRPGQVCRRVATRERDRGGLPLLFWRGGTPPVCGGPGSPHQPARVADGGRDRVRVVPGARWRDRGRPGDSSARERCVFHGFLPPSPWEGCHSVHVNAATQSTGLLPPSPRERCHVDHGKVATHARRSLPPSEQRDAGSLLLV